MGILRRAAAHPLAHAGLVVLAVGLIYGRTLSFGFTGFDDTYLIVANRAFLAEPANAAKLLFQDAFTVAGRPGPGHYYRPLLVFSLMLDALRGGTDPRPYHRTNILLHAAACLCCLVLLRRWLDSPGRALFLTMVLAVHPMLSQAVAWIPGRNDTLLAVWVLAALLALPGADSRRPVLRAGLHLLALAAALLTKETALALVLLVPAAVRWGVPRGLHPRAAALLVPGYAAAVPAWALLRHHALSPERTPLLSAEAFGRLVQNLGLVPQYFSKALLPWGLSTFSSPADTRWPPVILAVLLVGGAVAASPGLDRRRLALSAAWFLAFLVPSLLAPRITGLEHRVYVPLIGLLLAAGELGRVPGPTAARVRAAGAVMILACLTLGNLSYTGCFRDGLHFWKRAVDLSCASAIPYLNYGAALDRKGDLAAAERVYKAGLALDPAQPMLHNNLALVYQKTGRPALAEKEFLKEIAVNPGYAEAYYNLGLLYADAGLMDAARRMWRQARELGSDSNFRRQEN